MAQATLGSGCPFGVLPQGTFNYFSRTHGIPRDTAQALQVLLTQQPRAVQVGLVNDRVFLVNASMGLYADLLEERESHKARFGRHRWIAFYSGLLTVLRGRHRHWQLRIASHGHERDIRTPTLFVGNNPLQLMQAGVDHAEAPEQGRLTAVALKPVGLLAMPGLLVRGALGRLGDADEVTALPGEQWTERYREEQRQHQETEGHVEERRTDGDLVAGERLQHQRIKRAGQNRCGRRRQDQVVEDQRALARNRREDAAGFQVRGAQGEECEGAADEEDEDGENEDTARRIRGEGMNRGQHA
ncbi:lipid kinase, YegS/Rv2252/BmrU family [compost metagenome]